MKAKDIQVKWYRNGMEAEKGIVVQDEKASEDFRKWLEKAMNCFYAVRTGVATEEQKEFFEQANEKVREMIALCGARINEVYSSQWWDEDKMTLFSSEVGNIVVVTDKEDRVIKTYGLEDDIDNTKEYLKGSKQ